ncbi:MAG: AbrB/MazE/SpoVT family DNA-binding domain-containing protein [bacterium]
MTISTVTTKGQIVIPAKIRLKQNIKEGTKFFIQERGGEIILREVTEKYFENIAGSLKTKGKLSKKLIHQRKKDKNKDK